MKTKNEHVAPALILHWMGIEKLSALDVDHLTRKLAENLDGDLSFKSLGPGKSWNIPQMKMSARVLGAVHQAELADLYLWWDTYFKFQLGLLPTVADYPLLGFFDGNEPFSPTYTPWRWGAVAGVRFAARRDGRQGIVDLCDKWFRVAAIMAHRMAAPFPDEVRQKNRKGQLFDNAPHVSPVGERGASGHDITDTRLLIAELDPGRGFFTRRQDWPYKALVKSGAKDVSADLDGAFGGIRWWSEQHVLHFPSGRLVYKPKRQNKNTPCYMFDWYDYQEKTATLGFPWPDGRAFGAKGEGRCWIENGLLVVAETDCGSASCPLPSEPILSHGVFGPDGYTRLV